MTMLPTSRLLLLACAVIGAGPALAFKVPIHDEITRTAVATAVAAQIFSTGLNFYLPLAPPAGAITASVGRWIAGELSSPEDLARAMDLIAGSAGRTAECALNQLATESFATAIGSR
jgi:hypothetical protein